jgi:hypothetical protein
MIEGSQGKYTVLLQKLVINRQIDDDDNDDDDDDDVFVWVCVYLWFLMMFDDV